MSIESMALAMHHSRAKGLARLVLIGIANHDGDGGAWPAMATLAKYANTDIRNARKAVRQLEELGEIKTMQQRGGNGNIEEYQRPNLYKFMLTCPHDCDRTKNHKTRRDLSVAPLEGYPQPGGNSTGEGNSYGRGGTQMPSKPSTNHLTTDKDINSPTERGRARYTPCAVTFDGEHRINHKLGYCADCLEPLATITSPNRKEGDE